MNHRTLVSGLLFGLSLATAQLRAADYFWNPATVSGNWVTTANWGLSAAGPYNQLWSDGNVAFFSGLNQTITVNGTISVGGFDFSANGIRIAAGTGSVLITGTVSASVSGTNTAFIEENLSSVGAGVVLLKQGTGTLVLSGTNNLTTVNISTGTLRAGGASAFGSSALSPALVSTGLWTWPVFPSRAVR